MGFFGNNKETKVETCSSCGGSGLTTSTQSYSDSCDINGKRESWTDYENTVHGCPACGGSGSFPQFKGYTNSFLSTAQEKYDRDFKRNVKKGSGREKVVYEEVPCDRCGKHHNRYLGQSFGFSNNSDDECRGSGTVVRVISRRAY